MVRILSEELAAVYVPALEAAAKQEANTVCASTYANPETNSSLSVLTDATTGLGVPEWIFAATTTLW